MKPTDQNVREDSHDENDDNILAGNLLNAHKDSLYIAKSDAKPVIRGGPARRINSNSAAGDAGPTRGFVPRDLSSKVKRTTASNPSSKMDDDQSSRTCNHDDNGEDNEAAPWTKVPKKFLSEPAPVESTSNTRYETSKLPLPSKGRSESYTINSNNASPGSSKAKKSFSKPPAKATYRRPKEQDFEADSNSEQDEQDSKSVESSNTVEEFDAGPSAKVEKASSVKREEPSRARPASRQPPGKPQARGQEPPRQQPSNHHHQSSQQPGRQQDTQRREQERDFEIEGEEDDEDNDYDPTVMKDGEYYTDYVQRSQAMAVPPEAITRPNKSGRYEDHAADADSTNWMNSGSNRAVTSSRDNSGKTSWASVRPPANNAAGASEHSPSSRFSFVLVAHARGVRTEHVQCTVIRDRRASINGKLHPTYELILEETNKPILMAQKMNLNRTSNYHLFDLTRAQLSSKLSKKSGNYLGKLRAKNVNRTEYVLLNQNSEREEIAGVRFERVSLMNQLLQQESNQPRKMKIMVPPIDSNGIPIPNRTADSDAGSLAEKLSEYEATALGHGSKELHVFESKDPEFVNGNFRLNFHGRVSKPSVKNFQMVSRENVDDVICQFGKVDEDVFHLDFKAPINACQAFAFALCQFNL